MNRSASFRDKTENPILSSLPSMSRNTSTPKQEDVTNFLQCSRVDPKAMASEYKFNRHGDFKKLANNALAPNASPDDPKKLKARLRESITKGSERVKIFSDGVFAVDKCFPNIPTKPRSRPNGLSEKDREALRGPTSNGVPGEDRASPIVADGWENANMKRKRSVIKADGASNNQF
nr:hypothetical protein [Tanacetum cinerariifolium]